MKKKSIAVIVLNLLLVIGWGIYWMGIHQISTDKIELQVIYGEFHPNRDGGTSQLFWADEQEEFSEEKSLMCNIDENTSGVTFKLPKMDLEHVKLRFDPFMNDSDFSVYIINMTYGGRWLPPVTGWELRDYLAETENCESVLKDDEPMFLVETEDPVLYLSKDFNTYIEEMWRENILPGQERRAVLGLALFFWLEAGVLLFLNGKADEKIRMKRGHLIALIFADLALVLGASLCYGASYLLKYFGDLRVEELMFHMQMPLNGTNVSTFDKLFVGIGVIFVCITLLVFALDALLRRLGRKIRGYAPWTAVLGLILTVYALVLVGSHFDLPKYLSYLSDKTTIYEENYVDGKEVALTFPEKKRNLIYIFLESMEMTYTGKENGGAMEENYIPELTELGLANIDFSADGALNGPYALTGATYTMGAIVAQTAGIPINPMSVSYETVNHMGYLTDDYLLKGAWTIGDVLAEEGYQQRFLIGSDGAFGGRRAYMEGHGGYEVRDWKTAMESGRIPDGYKVWWGYEDTKLIDFAKEELLELAEGDQPFNFTMLTADTHFTDGYFCEKCENVYEDQYSNVISCSSRQIADFVVWMSQQEFWQDTTIVLVGDHLTMDSNYIEKKDAERFDRRVYFTIINPADGCKELEKRRVYSTMDLYPTTLAAMGVDIEGDRLGLGVNLFSDVPTLCETYKIEELDEELFKRSAFYEKQLLYKE